MIITCLSRSLIFAILMSFVSLTTAFAGLAGAQAVDEAWRTAIIANDLDGVMAVYADDAVMWLPDSPEAKGRDAIRKSYEGLLAANTVTGVTFANTQYQTSGDLSVGWGDFTLSLKPKAGGAAATMAGRFSVIARDEKGTWVYVVDHGSATPASAKSGG